MDATALDARRRRSSTWRCSRCRFTTCRRRAAARVFAEGTRVADKLLIIDLPRPPAPLHLVRLATMLPFAPFVPFVHDGVISSLRTYSPSALRALAAHADPAIEVELRRRVGPVRKLAVASRRYGSRPVGEEVRQTEFSRAHRQRVPAQGSTVPRRLRDDARAVQLRLRAAADRHGDRVQPRRRRLPAGDEQRRGARRRSPIPAYQTELGAYNIEFNVPPRPLARPCPRSSWRPRCGPASTPPRPRPTPTAPTS